MKHATFTTVATVAPRALLKNNMTARTRRGAREAGGTGGGQAGNLEARAAVTTGTAGSVPAQGDHPSCKTWRDEPSERRRSGRGGLEGRFPVVLRRSPPDFDQQ